MDAEPPLPRTARWRPWLIALAFWLALACVATVGLWHLRRDTLASQVRELGLLSLALTDEIDRGLQGAEEGLRALRAELAQGRLPLQHEDIAEALRLRAELMPLVDTLWLLGPQGELLVTMDDSPAPALASFLPALPTLPPGAVALSRPWTEAEGPPDAGDPQLAMALALPGGWMVAAMPASTLLGAFAVAAPAADARMAVFRADGELLATSHRDGAGLAEVAMAAPPAPRPLLELHRFQSGGEQLVSLHAVPRYGLHVVVTRPLAAALASWRQAAQVTTAALLLLLAALAAAVHFVQRADRRRHEAQQALQAQAARSTRLEALGTLAGSVAHDFNNVLAGILGYGEMAQDAAVPGSAQARHLDKVVQAALRGKALVERILAFSRGGARASAVFEFQPVVDEVLALLAASLPPGVVLQPALQAPGARLRGDATQAFEAVMNLCTNATQAMPEGGVLSVRLQRQAVAAPRVLSHSTLAAGPHLVLTVADQGRGITPEVMEHLFEPFFTTRAAQSGTGLGLAVVHGVVAELGGAIDVQSTPGQGARFTLYLPECLEAGPPPAASAPAWASAAGQALLVVDDEPGLATMAAEMLRGLGYEAVCFTEPQAALDALRAEPQRFAAVLTDEVMPGLTGTQLAQALQAVAPALPVLLVSGYGGALLAQRAAQAGVRRVLGKPLQRAELARALADVLQ
jgi:signal transduction histidine kinase